MANQSANGDEETKVNLLQILEDALFLFSFEIHPLVCCEFSRTCLSPEFSHNATVLHTSPFEEPSRLNGRQNQKLLQSNGGAGTSCAL